MIIHRHIYHLIKYYGIQILKEMEHGKKSLGKHLGTFGGHGITATLQLAHDSSTSCCERYLK